MILVVTFIMSVYMFWTMPFFEILCFVTLQLRNKEKLGILSFWTFARLCGHLYQQYNQSEMFIEPQTVTDTLNMVTRKCKNVSHNYGLYRSKEQQYFFQRMPSPLWSIIQDVVFILHKFSHEELYWNSIFLFYSSHKMRSIRGLWFSKWKVVFAKRPFYKL